MKLHRIIALVVSLSLAVTSGYSQAASGASGAGSSSTGTGGAAAGAGAAGGAAAGGITVGALAVGVAAAAAIGVAVAVASNNSNNGGVYRENAVSVAINNEKGTTTIAALSGTISYFDPNGVSTTIEIGTGLVLKHTDGTQVKKSLADILAEEKTSGTATNANSLTAALARGINNLASSVAGTDTNSIVLGGSAANNVAALAAIIKTVGTAAPDFITDYAKTSIAAIAANPDFNAEQKAAAAAAITEASLAAAPADQRGQQAAALQNVLADNAQGLGMDETQIASTVTSATNAANGTKTGTTPPPSTTITAIDTTIINVSPSSP